MYGGPGRRSRTCVMECMLPLLRGFGEDTSGNVFYVPLRTMPESIKEPERTRLTSSLGSAVKDKLLPAYRELHAFIQREYLPRTRISVALSALPLGPSWYAFRVKRASGAQLSPNQIHGIGTAEVERIRTRMLSLPVGAPLPPKAELLNAYQELKVQTLAALPALFSAAPRADFEIRASGLASEAAAPLAYQAADYVRAQLGVDASDAGLMTDRFVALPGDALACKMGELKFQALLTHARQALGARFDIREFHAEILKDGAMPMDILEAKMKLWMEA